MYGELLKPRSGTSNPERAGSPLDAFERASPIMQGMSVEGLLLTLPEEVSIPVRLAVAFGIGALIGLERERSDSAGYSAGVRTLPLVALLAAATAEFLPQLLVSMFLVVAVVVLVAYAAKTFIEEDPGATTAFATLLTFVFGAMTVQSDEALVWAVVLGTLTAAVLSFKEPAHGFVEDIGEDELRGTMKFLIVALVVMPLLPGEDVELFMDLSLNPRFVWLMVVFVSGISLGAYLLTNYLGARKGIALSGLLGGMASSTATTLAMTARARREIPLTNIYAFAIAVASMAMFPRVLIEVAVVNPGLLPELLPPVLAMLAVGSALSYVLLVRGEGERGFDRGYHGGDGVPEERSDEDIDDFPEEKLDEETDGAIERPEDGHGDLGGRGDRGGDGDGDSGVGDGGDDGGGDGDGVSDDDEGGEGLADVDLDNPFRLRPALAFGAVFAVILLLTDVAADAFGESGVYATAVVSGLADADAITLSLSRLAAEGAVSESTAVTGIVLGVAANTMTKFGLALVLGTRALGVRVGFVLVSTAVTGVAVVVLLT